MLFAIATDTPGFTVDETEEELGTRASEEPSLVLKMLVAHFILERHGSISIIPFKQEPRVLDVSVKDGVQTVRIKLE